VLHFFIDTNVLLSFYAFTQDDLTRLEQLAAQVEAGTFVILTTPHVEDEFVRNREAKIAESRKDFGTQRLDMRIPRLCDPYDETAELRRLAREYSQVHATLMSRIDDDARDRALMADQLVARFFDGATKVEVTSEMFDRARTRVALGNPPGKRGSLGDAVNWEALLAYRPQDQLFFVTDDGDFYSALDRNRPHEYLTREWAGTVAQPITFVRRLSELPAPVPQEVLPVDDAPDGRDELVSALIYSRSFQQTHQVIGALSYVQSFTARQVHDLIAALDNSQVGWIVGDEDVNHFYERLLETHADAMAESDRERLGELLDSVRSDMDVAEGEMRF
jgi:hypothetical protein